jgi:hypothetical protein
MKSGAWARGAAIIAGVLLAVAATLFVWHKYESAMLNRADGVVVRLDTTRNRYARPRVRFSTPAGQDVEFIAPDAGEDAAVGDTLRVLYNPLQPTDARVRSFRATWLVTTLFALLGVLFATVAVGMAWMRRPVEPVHA